MDYEEKYNKLVEAVKVLQKTNPSDEGIQNWVNDNVPELAESEDEIIRKWIINYLQYWADHASDKDESNCCKNAIAWLENIPYTIDHEKREGFQLGYKAGLEKQKFTQKDVDDAWLKGMCDAKDELEKQKPSWSEEDEERLKSCIYILQAKSIMGDVDTINTKWLKSLKERIGG